MCLVLVRHSIMHVCDGSVGNGESAWQNFPSPLHWRCAIWTLSICKIASVLYGPIRLAPRAADRVLWRLPDLLDRVVGGPGPHRRPAHRQTIAPFSARRHDDSLTLKFVFCCGRVNSVQRGMGRLCGDWPIVETRTLNPTGSSGMSCTVSPGSDSFYSVRRLSRGVARTALACQRLEIMPACPALLDRRRLVMRHSKTLPAEAPRPPRAMIGRIVRMRCPNRGKVGPGYLVCQRHGCCPRMPRSWMGILMKFNQSPPHPSRDAT
jgi:hypothetical protein